MPPKSAPFILKKQWYTRAKKVTLEDDKQVNSDDSDYEPCSENDCWEWILEENHDVFTKKVYPIPEVLEEDTDNISLSPAKTKKVISTVSPKPRIIGARNQEIEIRIGDAVSVNCGEPDLCVALIRSFDNDNFPSGKSKVDILWLSNHKDICNKQKKRMDFLQDTIDIDSINGPVELVSEDYFNHKYAKGVSRKSAGSEVIFICRRGCETRGAVYTDKFIWEDIKPKTEEQVEELYQRIKAETRSQKKKTIQKRNINKEIDQNNEKLETPRKKQKYLAVTPKKLKTPSKLLTPSHKRVMVKKPLEFTPLGTRILDFNQVASSPFQTARCRLHVSSVPESLPCREDEFATVYSHLEAAIIEGTGACIYISGTPGTGKTATVREVVAQLQAAIQADEIDPFNFVEINGMKITDPTQSYSILWEALKGERISPTHALDLLQREFTNPSPRRTPCVVLMDELDQLVTKNQLVMYNFFNWPGLSHSHLIVLAVANTMDLPERTLSNKISSRLGLTRITFPGYSFDQLMKIITSRLEGVPGNIVEKDAIEFASRKVAAVSGDARRVLDICRRAVELAESESLIATNPVTPSKTPGRSKGIKKVRIETIRRAIKEATTSPLINYLKELPLSSKLFLIALTLRIKRTGIGEETLGEVLDEAKKLAKQNTNEQKISHFLLTVDPLQISEYDKQPKNMSNAPRILAMGVATMNLVEAGIIVIETKKADRTGKVRMCIGDQDIKIAFRDDPEVKNLVGL
ncbi:Origin recognition complex subunit 1 [Erysiphe neolycopersici]|uniref:Origin recognition complex subunit 1 n=1 Tax=Erysiphe neolycopersici TaxID=212602 RepID=A0A420I3T0_9PEZI|nr:Origin recognition complex subunit 1 [Erysiphe neolycopersici]